MVEVETYNRSRELLGVTVDYAAPGKWVSMHLPSGQMSPGMETFEQAREWLDRRIGTKQYPPSLFVRIARALRSAFLC